MTTGVNSVQAAWGCLSDRKADLRMAHRPRKRSRLVLLSVMTLLAHGVGPARASGEAQLVSDIAAEAAGDEAYVQVSTVEGFSPSGGDALFAPGTESEEAFEYQTVDTSATRLLGLVRPAPLAHPAGTLIVPLPGAADETPSPRGTTSNAGAVGDEKAHGPTPSDPPSPSLPGSVEAGGNQFDPESTSAGSSASTSTTASTTPPTCELLFAQPCATVIAEVCNEGVFCDVVQDPGSFCEGVLCDILEDPLGLCAEGALCDILENPLGLCAEGIVCDLLEDPTRVCDVETVVCDVVQDPLGPWSACDVNGTGEECPDPEDVTDPVWGTSLGGLTCTANVTGPRISDDGGLVEGRGSFDCGEFVAVIKIEVCLHRSTGGAWLKMGCREHAKGQDASGGVWGKIHQPIAEPCGKGTTQKYRIRAKGWAVDGDGPDAYAEGADTAKATATLFCPGISTGGAANDAGNYADSWVPTDD